MTSSQYHSQDEFGNYEYGYDNINSAKRERGNSRGVVEGSYTYVDGHGLPQQVNYVADALGFRATSSNLVANRIYRKRRSAPALAVPADALAYAGLTPAAAAPLAAYAGAPLGAAAPLVAPTGAVAYAAGPLGYSEVVSQPATREGILTRILNNPGHAVSYRVD